LIAAAWTIPAALLLHFAGLNPIVKRIWTPAWTLFSGGCCFLLLALFARFDGQWMKPLTIIGTNSIAAYLIAHLCEGFFESTWRIHLGPGLPALLTGAMTLGAYWLVLWWMHRRKLYLRI
jgi:predicted acyltransferase